MGDQAIGRLDHRHLLTGDQETHHRSTHDDTVGVRVWRRELEQFAHRRTDQHFVIAWRVHVAADCDQSRNDRFAVSNGPPGRVGGGNVETLDAEIGRAFGGRYFLAGEDANQLLGATGRVKRRHLDDQKWLI